MQAANAARSRTLTRKSTHSTRCAQVATQSKSHDIAAGGGSAMSCDLRCVTIWAHLVIVYSCALAFFNLLCLLPACGQPRPKLCVGLQKTPGNPATATVMEEGSKPWSRRAEWEPWPCRLPVPDAERQTSGPRWSASLLRAKLPNNTASGRLLLRQAGVLLASRPAT